MAGGSLISWPGETVVILGGGASLTQRQVDYCRGKARVVAINKAYQLAPGADVLWAPDVSWFWQWSGGPDRFNKSEPDALDFGGLKFVLSSPSHPGEFEALIEPLRAEGVHVMRHRGEGWHTGVELEPGFVRGNNSCYHLLSSVLPQAGVGRVILLGIDMTPGRFHEGWHMGEPEYECRTGERPHRAVLDIYGREIELGWYEKESWARRTEALYLEHITADCPNPAPHLYGMIPRYATLVEPLAKLGVEVVQCTPDSALRAFPMARLEDVL